MERFLEIIQEYDTLIMVGILGLLVILILLQIINKVQLSRMSKRYKKLFRTSKKDNLEQLIVEYGDRVEEVLDYTRDIHRAYKSIDERISGSVQKVGIVRYKAFDDIGSDLSFSVALLDESDTGIILTGIYGRTDSTTFAKPIDNGISKYDLSEEEREAIDRAHRAYEDNNRYRMEDIDEIQDVRDFSSRIQSNVESERNIDEDFREIDEIESRDINS
ncbi:MAG: DUF4446 family protein [Clostridium sp.]|uniref:DUF4446 family protein n=1 Tax=Clostridium sp. TaxID=1506 RepID=UPI002FC84625